MQNRKTRLNNYGLRSAPDIHSLQSAFLCGERISAYDLSMCFLSWAKNELANYQRYLVNEFICCRREFIPALGGHSTLRLDGTGVIPYARALLGVSEPGVFKSLLSQSPRLAINCAFRFLAGLLYCAFYIWTLDNCTLPGSFFGQDENRRRSFLFSFPRGS
jgi:hypothetical protein